MHLDDLLRLAVERGASDLHLKPGAPPTIRLHGRLQPLDTDRMLLPADTEAFASQVLSERYQEAFDSTQDVDLAYRLQGFGRFRCNVYQQRSSYALVLRVIPHTIPTIEELLLPPVVRELAGEERGLVLVTGLSGSGKSTTLAAMVQHMNQHRTANVVTIEDPIEYLHKDNTCLVSQREVSVDTRSFAQALRASLRQDPDVILVGEMRDRDTIETALTAAETGHLVLSTLHTLDASEAINRIVGVFDAHQQLQIRTQLAGVLRAVISQRLVPRCDVPSRCVAVEAMVVTPFIRGCMVEPLRTAEIRDAIASGRSQYGMQTFDQSIFEHYEAGRVSYEDAVRYASRADEFRLMAQGISGSAVSVASAVDRPTIQYGR